MRRIIIATTAAAVLVAATAAYAQTTLNTYTGSLTFSSSSAGTPAKPVPASFKELFQVTSSTAANAAPVTDIKLKMYGLKIDSSAFPTCSLSKVSASNGQGCPKKSLIGSGPIKAYLYNPNPTEGSATITCTPTLDIWNAGHDQVVEFPIVAQGQCGPFTTGAAAPYLVTFKQQGNYLLQDAPLPPDVSTNAGNAGLYNALASNDLTWAKATAKVKGKTVAFLSSIGCDKGKRPYTMTFTATNGTVTQTAPPITGSGKC